jgi:GNAT superfamily N-acetyltransferase
MTGIASSRLLNAEPAVLRDGSAVDVRPTAPGDRDRLVAFYESLSDDSRLMRFLSVGVDLEDTAEQLLAPDICGLLAVAGTRVVGHACLAPSGTGTAELAFGVADDWQQRGLATILLERLVAEMAAADSRPSPPRCTPRTT